MNITQKYDLEKLNSINLNSLIEYLEENGWQKKRDIDNRASIWAIRQRNKKFSVLLPLENDIPDFEDRLTELFQTLEFVEQRSVSEIVSNLINVSDIASEKQREIITLRFKFLYEMNKREASAKKTGIFLESLQDLFNAVGQEESGITSNSGRIQKNVIEKTELSLFEVFQGSFGMKLALAPHPEQLNLFESERSLAEIVSEDFLQIIKYSNQPDKEKLKEQLLRLKRRSASRYRKFLMSLINTQADLHINWGSVNRDKGGKAELRFQNAIETIEFINKMEIEEPDEYIIDGELIAASKSKNSIEIEETRTKKKYVGTLAEKVINNKSLELTIGRLYSATVEEISSINPTTGEEKTESKITDLLYLGSS